MSLLRNGTSYFSLTGGFEPAPVVIPPSGRGFDETTDGGTTADYYVDGSISPSGTTYQTVAAAVAQAVSDGVARTIMVKDTAVYREFNDLDGFEGTICGYGTDKPLITGQEVLTGWTQCTSGDESRVGSNFANIYKKNIPLSSIGSLNALNVYEGDIPVPVCQVRPTTDNLFFPTFNADFVTADDFILNGSSQITGIQDADVLSGVTSAQLVNQAFAQIYKFGNSTSVVNVTGFDDVDTVDVDGLYQPQGGAAVTPENKRWNLCNCLPKMTVGTYGTYNEGDSTITVYVWPNNPANLETGAMTYAARVGIFRIPVGNGNITFENLQIRGAGGATDTEGYCIWAGSAATPRVEGLTIRNCLLGDTMNTGGAAYGAVIAQIVDDFTLEHSTIRQASGAFGMFLTGFGATRAMRGRVQNNIFTKTSVAATRFFGVEDVICAFNNYFETSRGGHANSWNFYSGSTKCLFYGNFLRDVYGYGTWQAASNIYVGCNVHQSDVSAGAILSLVDQNSVTKPQPDPGSTHYVWCNDFLPHISNLTGGVVALGSFWHSAWAGSDATHPENDRYVYINNLVHGGGVSEPYGTPSASQDYWDNRPGFGPNHVERQRDGNLYTALAGWQDISNGWTIASGEDLEEDLAVVFTSVAGDDYTCPPSSPALTHTGVSLVDTIAAASAIWPSFDFTKDMHGNTINLDTPKVGALHGDRNAQTTALWA